MSGESVGATTKGQCKNGYGVTGYINLNYYLTGTTKWRVPDDKKWYIRDTTYTEPNGDYTISSFLGLNTLTSDGSVTAFNERDNPNYYTGTTVICSTNVKGFSYFD